MHPGTAIAPAEAVRWRGSLVLVMAPGLAAACARDETEGEPRPLPLVESARSPRHGLVVYERLLDRIDGAELDAGGLFIDLGTADQHKYTRGGWRSGWGKVRAIDEAGEPVTYAEMTGRRAWLDVAAPARAPPVGLLVRARSRVPGQTLTVHVGRRRIATIPLAPVWLLVSAELPPGVLRGGSARLELRASRARAPDPFADVDWIWLRTGDSEDPPPQTPRATRLAVAGTVERVIAAGGPRTYSFYLQPRRDARFIADLGAAGRATFIATATVDGAPPVELLRETVAGRWREQSASLERFADRAIRLDLTTSDQTGEAGWGEPAIAIASGRQVAMHPVSTPDGMPEAEEVTRSRPVLRRLLEVQLGQALADPELAARADAEGVGNRDAVDPALRRRLHALGYIGHPESSPVRAPGKRRN